jgi:heme/copper-type cytochrome/quinol oxidase subunit 4
MANAAYLVSTLVMALLGVGVVVLVLRGRAWRNYVPQAAYGLAAGAGRPRSGLAKVAGSTNTWTAGFIFAMLVVLGAVVVASSGAVASTVAVGLLGLGVVAYLVAGTYFAIRESGRSAAQATAAATLVLGLLLVAVIGINLVLGL